MELATPTPSEPVAVVVMDPAESCGFSKGVGFANSKQLFELLEATRPRHSKVRKPNYKR